MNPFSPRPIDSLNQKSISYMDFSMIIFGIFIMGGIVGFFYSNSIHKKQFNAKCFMTREYMIQELDKMGFDGTKSMQMCVTFAGQNGVKK